MIVASRDRKLSRSSGSSSAMFGNVDHRSRAACGVRVCCQVMTSTATSPNQPPAVSCRRHRSVSNACERP
ncbi:hypothetical protein ACFQZ4_01045 [Catellatospora coxensis]